MDTAIKVGTEITKDGADRIAQLIETVFRVGAETRMDQETIREALNLIVSVSKIENVSISGCTIKGDTHVHTEDEAINLGLS